MRMRRDHNATKKKRQTSYDWCRCCHRKMFTRNTRNSIARIVKKNIFHFFFSRIGIALVEDRLARRAIALRTHTKRFALCNYRRQKKRRKNGVAGKLLVQLWLQCTSALRSVRTLQSTFKCNYTYLYYLNSDFFFLLLFLFSFHFSARATS